MSLMHWKRSLSCCSALCGERNRFKAEIAKYAKIARWGKAVKLSGAKID